MAVPPDDRALAAGRRWAARQLRVGDDATVEQARTAFLRRVAANDFGPDPRSRDARDIFVGLPSARTASRLTAESISVREAMDEELASFAEQFFQLAPDDRRSRFDALGVAVAEHAPLRAQLYRLRAGLNVDAAAAARALAPRSADGDLSGRLGAACLELFVLAPTARAARRRQLLSELSLDASAWRDARRRLRREAPAVAALASDFLEGEIRPRGRAAKITTRVRTALHTDLSRPERRAPAGNRSKRLTWMILGWLFFAGVGALIGTSGSKSGKRFGPIDTTPPQRNLQLQVDLQDLARSPVGRRLLGLPPLPDDPHLRKPARAADDGNPDLPDADRAVAPPGDVGRSSPAPPNSGAP